MHTQTLLSRIWITDPAAPVSYLGSWSMEAIDDLFS